MIKRTYVWQDWVLLLSMLLLMLYYFLLFSMFNQLPSEYYGGDHYAHLASATKIYNTFNPFMSSHYVGELQHYPWLTAAAIALFAKIVFVTPLTAAIYFPLLILILTIIITYIFGNRYFKNKTIALILAISWAVQLVPSMHPSEIAKQLMMPLMAFFILLLYEKQRTRQQTVIAGIIYGIAGLQHMVTFFMASVIVFIVYIFQIIENRISFDTIKIETKKIIPVIVIGWCLAGLFWVPLVVKYNGETHNDWQVYTTDTLYPSAGRVTLAFKEVFGFKDSVKDSIGAVLLISIVLFYSIKKADKKLFIPFFLFFAALIGLIHPYITMPLLNLSLGYYRFPIAFVFIHHLMMVLGLYYVWTGILAKRKIIKTILSILIIVWILYSFLTVKELYVHSERYYYSVEHNKKLDGYSDMVGFIVENNVIDENTATAATHPDFGFLFNAFTAKPVLATRITHANPFVDHNQRTADMAIILYGNDDEKRKELLEQYNIHYFFLELGSLEYDEYCRAHWNETKKIDKKDKTIEAYWCLQTDPRYEKYVESYGIETATAYVRLAAGDKDVPRIKILAIKSGSIQLDLKKIYKYEEDGVVILELYEILS